MEPKKTKEEFKRGSDQDVEESKKDYIFRRAVTEELGDYGVLSIDKKGKITSWNRGAEKLFGYKEEEAVGKNCSFIFTPEDREENQPEKELLYALKKSQTMHERFMVPKNKVRFWASGIIFPLHDKNGGLCGYTKIISDITENKEFERRKDDFINTATHEIRTPITTMKLFADIVKNKTKNSKSTSLNDSVLGLNEQIDRLIALTNYLLDVSKIQRGKLQIDPGPFDLQADIELLVATLKPTSLKHEFVVNSHLKHRAYGDSDRINQVLTNLLSNAIKYSPKGGKIIITTQDEEAGTKVTIQDFGLGISEDEQKKIFTRFFRADVARKTNIAGIGLGLYIARKIIMAHNGEIGMTSVKGKGSTFFFTLPNQTTINKKS